MSNKKEDKSVCSWFDYAQVARKLGFDRVTIVNRNNFKVIAKTGTAPNYPCMWQDGETVINELAELNSNWLKREKTIFYFYGMKFEIIDKDIYGGKWVQCRNKEEYLNAFQFKEIWFVVYHQNKGGKEAIFKSPKESFAKINELLEPLSSWIHMN